MHHVTSSAKSPVSAPPMPMKHDHCALMLDVDQIFLDTADATQADGVSAEVSQLLGGLIQATDGALALISGRQLGDVDQRFGRISAAVAASDGLDLRHADGSFRRRKVATESHHRMHEIVVDLAARLDGVHLEESQQTATLHCDQDATQLSALRIAAKMSVAQLPGYELQPGRDSVEFRPVAMNKGLAVREFLRHRVFAGRTLIYLGGDLSDEQAFKRVNRVHGHSVRIGNREPTLAHYSLPDAAAARMWLGELRNTLAAGSRH